jgi:hypothetical protein
MITIWKYLLGFGDITRLEIPKDGEILSIQRDDKTNSPCLWIMVNSDNPQEERVFELFGTGHNVPFNMSYDQKYIGTYQSYDGEFVGHIFEQISI